MGGYLGATPVLAQVDGYNRSQTDALLAQKLALSGGVLTGLLDTGAIGQIKFPAAQNASADANTLDDYEEGTWTPTLGGYGSVSYTYRLGSYTKIGRIVIAYWDFNVSSVAGSWNGQISGLPLPVSMNMAGYSVVHHRSADLFNANGISYGQLKGFAEKGQIFMALQVDYSTTDTFGTATNPSCKGSGRSTGYVIYEA